MTDRSVEPDDASAGSSSLLVRATSGNATAWARLVGLYSPVVYGWCRRWGLRPQDAEVIGQEVFLRVFRSLGTFRRTAAGDSFRGWLHEIARNCAADHRRREQRTTPAAGGSEARAALDQVAEIAHEDESQHRSADEALLFRRAMELIQAEFSHRDWTAFREVVMEGRPAAEVAAELGVSSNVVYLAKSRVLRRLREEFAELVDF